MDDPASAPEPKPKLQTRIGQRAGKVLRSRVLRATYGVLAFIGLSAVAWGAFALYGAMHRPPGPVDPQQLTDEWNATVGRLGVSPVFPPEEDVRVGDLYAVIGGDTTLQNRAKKPMEIRFGQAIKLDHLRRFDDALADFYHNVFVFPQTTPRPASADASWAQSDCTKPCFEAATARTQLPLVLFPGFKFSHSRQSSFGASWLGKAANALVGGATDDAESIDIRVPYAESYGIPNIAADRLRKDYCTKVNPEACTEDFVRQSLSMVLGPDAVETIPGDRSRYRYEVRLILIARVYVTRAVQYSFASDSAFAAQARLALQIENRLAEEGASGAAQQAAAAEAERRLQTAIGDALRIGSGSDLRIAASDSDRVSVDQTLPRPVAIGFNGISIPLARKATTDHVTEPQDTVPQVVEPEP